MMKDVTKQAAPFSLQSNYLLLFLIPLLMTVKSVVYLLFD